MMLLKAILCAVYLILKLIYFPKSGCVHMDTAINSLFYNVFITFYLDIVCIIKDRFKKTTFSVASTL